MQHQQMRAFPAKRLIAATLVALALGIAASAQATAAETASVSIENFTFSPAELTVTAGTTVTFSNHDDIPHTVVATDKSFKSKPLDTDDTYTITFKDQGSFDYFCSLHPHMTGKVIVLPNAG